MRDFPGSTRTARAPRINQGTWETHVWGQGPGANSARESITEWNRAWESERPVVAEKRVTIVEPRGRNADRAESEEGRAN